MEKKIIDVEKEEYIQDIIRKFKTEKKKKSLCGETTKDKVFFVLYCFLAIIIGILFSTVLTQILINTIKNKAIENTQDLLCILPYSFGWIGLIPVFFKGKWGTIINIGGIFFLLTQIKILGNVFSDILIGTENSIVMQCLKNSNNTIIISSLGILFASYIIIVVVCSTINIKRIIMDML